MFGFSRSPKLPAADEQALAAYLGERPRALAWAATDDGLLVATPARLVRRVGEEWTSLGWDDIETGGWDPEADELRWVVRDAEGRRVPTAVALAEPGRLPEVFRERVDASFAVATNVEVDARRGATITARRDPAASAPTLDWRVIARPGTDLDDPEVADVVERALAEAKADYAI